ncbi:cytochrome c oxidase assembly protein [Prauserella oleivorans]|uniref:Cytochrome c oxidase assembly protein n=1 Tax=Prauserella oleivorans TaxID=1478153 RepID=A0ABW5W5H3_9PSEU
MSASGLLLVVVAGAALAYVTAALRAGRWSAWRTASWLSACLLIAVALSPPLSGAGPRAHMAQHVLLGMLAPIGLVAAAPVTLLLRTLPPPRRRPVVRVLRARPVRVLGHPATAAVLDVGGLYLLLLTPVAAAAHHAEWAAFGVHVHYLAAGYLFTWSIAGPDPAPGRPGLRTRLAVFVLAAGAHSVLAKLLYARASGHHHDAHLNQEAAQLMYYGGDLAEVLLAVLLFATWYRRRARHRPRRTPAASG